jgi:hypothetical protein
MGEASSNASPTEPMGPEEEYHHVFFYFVQALRILAMGPDPQCDPQGNYNVAFELQAEILSGRYLIGKGRLDDAEEAAIAALATTISTVPDSALVFANGHASNVRNMMNPVWAPIRAEAVSLLTLLGPRILQNNAYFEKH